MHVNYDSGSVCGSLPMGGFIYSFKPPHWFLITLRQTDSCDTLDAYMHQITGSCLTYFPLNRNHVQTDPHLIFPNHINHQMKITIYNINQKLIHPNKINTYQNIKTFEPTKIDSVPLHSIPFPFQFRFNSWFTATR